MPPFDELWIWDDPALRESLAWYLDVAENRRPANVRSQKHDIRLR